METTLRILLMLSLIPREAESITTEALRDKLDDLGYGVGVRTVQRDLGGLSCLLPLVTRPGERRTLFWSWAETTPTIAVGGTRCWRSPWCSPTPTSWPRSPR